MTTPTQCECTCSGSCTLLGWNDTPRKMNDTKYQQCQDPKFFQVFYNERELYYNKRLEIAEELKNRPTAVSRAKKPKAKTKTPVGVGTTFRKLLDEFLTTTMMPKFGIKKIPSCSCGALEREMNSLGPNGCISEIDNLCERIVKNTTAGPITSPFVRLQAKRLINKAVEQHTKEVTLSMPRKMKWSYGITTVPQRKDDLFPATLESLQKSGFDQPHLFVDNCKRPSDYDKYDLLITTRYPRVKTAAHWSLSMLELYMREPAADRYAIFQDDFVTYKNLRSYLEKCTYEPNTY